jgi:hypothetical protein
MAGSSQTLPFPLLFKIFQGIFIFEATANLQTIALSYYLFQGSVMLNSAPFIHISAIKKCGKRFANILTAQP